jgi:cytochrome c oxidase subunit 2
MAPPFTTSAGTFLQSVLYPQGIQAERIWNLWNLTLMLCGVVFFLIVAVFLYALWRAPRSTATTKADIHNEHSKRVHHIAIAWALGLSAAGLGSLFAVDILTARKLSQLLPDDALRIDLTGHQWWWQATYLNSAGAPDFIVANELQLPVGRTVLINLRSDDVIHSLWIPALHGKLDLIPGRTATLRLRADAPGSYRGQCAEFCGEQHALMALLAVAKPADQYEAWAVTQRRPVAPLQTESAKRGLQVFLSNGCASCHTIRGTAAAGTLGPDLTHLAARETLAAGMLPNQRGHLAGWIANARAIKPGVAMPPSTLTPNDLHSLLDFMETLR